MNWLFGSKAETLEFLRDKVTAAEVLPQVVFSVGDWRDHHGRVLDRLHGEPWVRNGLLAVRSSSGHEDCQQESGAGRYQSLLDVRESQLRDAIERVISSYGEVSASDQVLIQPMVEDIVACGVVTSCEPGTGRPYAIASWADGADPRAVTSGGARSPNRWLRSRAASGEPRHEPLRAIISLLTELEEILCCRTLDVEFAIGRSGLVLLQARPLAKLTASPIVRRDIGRHLRYAERFIQSTQGRSPLVLGKAACFSVMTDWNPAEMIGRRPDSLALSLYRELITDRIWADQRHAYGYRDLRGLPLLVTIAGQPYIDVRLSLNSFVPAALPQPVAERLVDSWLDILRESPSLHDKVEFEVALTQNSFDLPRRLCEYRQSGFSASECRQIDNSLRELTNGIMRVDGPWQRDLREAGSLEERRRRVLASDLPDIAKIYALLRDCRRYGTRPFAGLARAAFVAVKILRSMVDEGIIDSDTSAQLLGGLSNTCGDVLRDSKSLTTGEFLKRHGHLRPGTYNINRCRYDEAVQEYFGEEAASTSSANLFGKSRTNRALTNESTETRVFDGALARLVEGALTERGFETDALGLERFIRRAIEARERAKWEFSKNISEILVLIERVGKHCGLTREDCSFLTIRDFEELHTSALDERTLLRRAVRAGRQRERIMSTVIMPPFLSDARQVWEFSVNPCEPTFVTRGVVVAAPVLEPSVHQAIAGRIALIQAADPGFDWIFCHGIVGLITAYGGTNSHMAIRAAELSVPAVLGVGEECLAEWARAGRLQIDCNNHSVRIAS